MKTPVYDLTGKTDEEITLPSSVFNTPLRKDLISVAISNYLANQRSSHAKAKNRSEVAGTTKKVWSQKGTGHARHGSRKAPIFVGGGATHAPHGDRNFKKKLNKKTKKVIVNSLLSQFAKDKNIIVVKGLSKIDPKTKSAHNFINILEKDNKNLANSNKISVITSKTAANIKRAFGNLAGFNLLSLKSLNAYDLANQNFLIFTKKALNCLK